VFTLDPSETNVHVIDQMSVSDRAVDEWNKECPTLVLIPTGLYEALITDTRSRPYSHENIRIILYSDHSSYDELHRFVQFIKPTLIYPVLTSVNPDSVHHAIPERSSMQCFHKYLNKKSSLELISNNGTQEIVLSCSTNAKVFKRRKRMSSSETRSNLQRPAKYKAIEYQSLSECD